MRGEERKMAGKGFPGLRFEVQIYDICYTNENSNHKFSHSC